MALAALLLAVALPQAPTPAAPFPRIITDAPTFNDVAPGVTYGEYRMRTADGPLSVHVIAVDPHNPTVRIETTLAQNRLVSSGETTSSMGARTGAVAGVNGDYFDINQTNQPLNLLISNSRLIRMPMHRWAVAFDKDNNARFAEYSVNETATLADGSTIPLKTMNDWPPPGGEAVFMTPEYGPLRPIDGVNEIQLEPVNGEPPAGTYRVTGVADNSQTQSPGFYLAIGPNASRNDSTPQIGDTIRIDASTSPPTSGIVSAIGGGPLLVRDGAWYADPDGPSKGEFATHMPATSIGVTHDGKLLLFEIDGRQPALSIGVLQPQLAALMIAFGVVTGMQFDGGGSSTMIARLPGDTAAKVQNSPSDGIERRVADALMIDSDAPAGGPARIYARPQVIRAMPGARVPVDIAVTDAGVHPVTCNCHIEMRVVPGNAGRIENGAFVTGARSGEAAIAVSAGALHLRVPVQIMQAAKYVDITPEQPAVRSGESIRLQVNAFDDRGYPITLPSQLPWHATSGTIDRNGHFTAGRTDALIDVQLGETLAHTHVTVGEHSLSLPLARYAQFTSAPRGGAGSVDKDTPCAECLSLRYDFTGSERAAYASAAIPLPARALAIAADVLGDGNGETLRLAVNNAINERFLYTVAKVDWHGWRHLEFRFPPALAQPITFKALYVINKVGPEESVQAAGSIALRDVRLILAGSAEHSSK